MSNLLFYTLLTIRLIAPPFVFKYIHPFYAMILDELVLDGFIAPHHIFKPHINPKFHPNRKRHYDIPLDLWGFICSAIPLVCKKHKYYPVFKGFRKFLLFLLAYRTIGIMLVYPTHSMKHLKFFPNLYIGAYLAVSGCHLLKIKDKRAVIATMMVFMVIFYARELVLIQFNKNMPSSQEYHQG